MIFNTRKIEKKKNIQMIINIKRQSSVQNVLKRVLEEGKTVRLAEIKIHTLFVDVPPEMRRGNKKGKESITL